MDKSSMVARRLLIVGDDDSGADALDEAANAFGWLVRRGSGEMAIGAALRDFGPDAVLLDPEARDGATSETLRGVARTGASLLLLGGLDDRAIIAVREQVRVAGMDVAGILAKPVSPEGLEAALRALAGDLEFSAAEIGAAVMRGEITAWYQLQLARDGSGWRADGAEALARWEHPEHGTVLPDAFLPAAEAGGQIAAITDCVLLNSVQQLGAWHREGLAMRIGVNLAPSLVTDPHFPERLARLLHEYDVPARALILEIPESGLHEASSAFLELLARLRVHGFGLALEHFGSGISSLADLYRTPFSELKISRRLVARLDEDEDARRLVRGIIQLARELGIGTAAEAVETQMALEFLHDAGCDRVQGYLVSRPLPAIEFQAAADHWR